MFDVAARGSAVPGVRGEGRMTCTRREHTVWTTCTCPACRDDKKRMNKRQRTGRWHRVTADQAWDRIDGMLRQGWTAEAIASASGVRPDTIQAALSEWRLRGHRQQFGPSISARIVNAGQPTVGKVGAVGSRHRLQALSRMGHGAAVIAREAGLSTMAVSIIRAGGTELVTPRVASGIAAAFDLLAMTPGTSKVARRYAEGKGWAPPLAWDNIDDPDERPSVPTTRLARMADVTVDEVAVLRAARGERLRLTANERAATVGLLAREGMSDRLIAERLGMSSRNVLRIRTRDGVAAVHDPAGNRVTA